MPHPAGAILSLLFRIMEKPLIISTTNTLEGYSLRVHRGIVTGEAIPGANGGMLMVTAAGTAVKPG